MNEWRLNYINGKPFPDTRMFDGVQQYRIAAECNGYVLGVTEKGDCAVWTGGYHVNGELREVSGGSYFIGLGFGSSPEKCFERAFALFAERASGGKVASVEETRLEELDLNKDLKEQGFEELGKIIRQVEYEHSYDFGKRTDIKTYCKKNCDYYVITEETDELADISDKSYNKTTYNDMINAFVDAEKRGDKYYEEGNILQDCISCHIFDEQLKDDVKQAYENREQSEELDLTQQAERGR